VVAALVAGGALLAGFVGWCTRVWVQSLFARRDRLHERDEVRRERGLELVGQIRALLDDANPLVMSINRSSDTPRKMQSLVARWSELRKELVTYSTAHPSERVKTLEREFEDMMWILLTSTGQAVEVMTEGMIPLLREDFEPNPGGRLEAARHDYRETSKLLDELEGAVRGRRRFHTELAA
jgi:hypothetical protein